MKILKDWTKFEKILLIGSIALIALIGIIFKSNLLTISSSIVGIITALLLAKGKYLGNIFGLLIVGLYSIVSFKNRYYGEVIIYVFIMLPMYIIGINSWIKHQNEKTKTVEVNGISKKECLLSLLVSVIAFGLIYFVLKSFNTDEIIISSVSVLTSLIAVYLIIRRSKYSFYFFVINDIVLMLLWGIPVIKGNLVLIPMLFNPIINLINDSYGIYNWKKLEEKQNGKF